MRESIAQLLRQLGHAGIFDHAYYVASDPGPLAARMLWLAGDFAATASTIAASPTCAGG
ncbi:MAG TPA: hypothetical protein VNV37_07265 [Solirubrobacteraceae bacterium]|nr:hypothetical protein [Solirubrobacteraceae bacterium]